MCTADQSSVTSRDVSSGSPIGSFSQQPDPAGAIEAGDKRPTERTAANNGRNNTTAGDCEFTPHGDIPLGDATVAFHWSPEALDALDASIGEPVAGRDETPSGSDGLRRRRTDTLIPLTTPNIRAFIEGDEASRPSAVVPTASTASGSKESSSLRQLTRKSMREGDRSQVERQVPKLPNTLSSNRVRPAHETLTDDPSFHSSLPELPPDPGAALAADYLARLGAVCCTRTWAQMPSAAWQPALWQVRCRA